MSQPMTVDAKPAKRFFVSMLTRDIELRDAIMDLIDNCVDGVLRQLRQKESTEDKPYDGYFARIAITSESFSITDNCGGISKQIAKESAFRLGRLDTDLDKDIATVGMYGIGMKRALFKMGQRSSVFSRHKDESYKVEITPEWLSDDDDWLLPLTDIDSALSQDGTQIEVWDLYQTIATQFSTTASNFLRELENEISSYYALILSKGFKIYLNNKQLSPINLEILVPADFHSESVPPYAYRGAIDDVNIELFVGFYRKLATEAEIIKEQVSPRSRNNAGWTVICNDRVVLHHDTSQLTGWGTGDVPRYHNQFIAIAGVVRFASNQPLNLPLNTTKRGLDTSSPVYWHTLFFMQDGLKKFTAFTNHWKGREEETTPNFEGARLLGVTEVIKSIPNEKWGPVRGREGERFIPDLPRPARQNSLKRIVIERESDEIRMLGEYFFDNAEATPAHVGNKCFDECLAIAKEEE